MDEYIWSLAVGIDRYEIGCIRGIGHVTTIRTHHRIARGVVRDSTRVIDTHHGRLPCQYVVYIDVRPCHA